MSVRGSKHVLVVDDNDESRSMVALFLKRAGFEVAEAATGGEALRRAGDHPIVVVLDVRLPDVDGFEVCRRLKAGADTRAIPVLHLSAAYRGREERARGLASGADGYLTHPVEPAELVTAVRTLVRLRAAQSRLARLFNRTSQPMLTADRDGGALELNDAARRVLRIAERAGVGARLRPAPSRLGPVTARRGRTARVEFRDAPTRRIRIAARADLPSGRAVLAIAGDGATPAPGWRRDSERLTRLVQAQAESVAIVRGIAERRQAEDTRRQLASIVESSEDAIVGETLDGIVFSWNAGAERMYGYTSEEIKGRSASILDAPEGPDDTAAIVERVRRGEHVVQHETVRVTKDGRPIDVSLTASPLRDERGRVWGVSTITRDITEQKRAEERLRESEEQLRALSRHVESVREQERAEIAREIHDELGQGLTALKMELAALAKETDRERRPLRGRIDPMLRSVDTIIQHVRKIASALRPSVLDVLGIAAAVEWQAREFQARTGIRCRLESRLGDLALDRDRRTAVFRIVQESLTNVARHASAKNVTIELRRRRGHVVLGITDDGRGIRDREMWGIRSLGIAGMRERAALLGGHLVVGAIRGGGTRVLVTIPCDTGGRTAP